MRSIRPAIVLNDKQKKFCSLNDFQTEFSSHTTAYIVYFSSLFNVNWKNVSS